MNVHSDKRALILDSALSTFGELGYSNTSIKDIARCADIAPGSIYNYFGDKGELFRCAVEESWAAFFQQIDAAIEANDSFVPQFEAVIDIGLDRLRIVHPLLRGMFSEANRLDLLSGQIDALCTRLDRLLVEAAANGIVTIDADPEQRRFFLRTMASGILLTAAVTPPERLAEEIEHIRDRSKRGLFTGTNESHCACSSPDRREAT